MATADDLLFEETYLSSVIPRDPSLSPLGDDLNSTVNIPAALASAAYGYTRGGLHSVLYAALFGYFGLQFPLISTTIIAVDAVFLNDTPAARSARELYAQHKPAIHKRLGFSGVSGQRRCKNGYRRRHGLCVRKQAGR